MYFFIILLVPAFMIVLFLIAKKRHKGKRIPLRIYAVILLCPIALGVPVWSLICQINETLYDEMIHSDSVVAFYSEADAVTISNLPTYQREGEIGIRGLPKYAREDDLIEICKLSFYKEGQQIVTARVCKIQNASNYPRDAIVNYQGNDYCFLSEKVLYRNSFFFLNADFVRYILSEVL